MGFDLLHSFIFVYFWAGQPTLPPGPTLVVSFLLCFFVAVVDVAVVDVVVVVVVIGIFVGVFVVVAGVGVYFGWCVHFMLCAFCF